MTAVLEEVIVDLSQDKTGVEQHSQRNGIGRRITECFDVSEVLGRRVYLLCFGEEVSDVTVSLAVMDMPDRDSALIGDLLALKAHADRFGQFPFPVVCCGSWTSIERRIYYPCLRPDADRNRSVVDLVSGTDYWPADTRFLVVDK